MTLDTHSLVLKQNSTYPYKIQRDVQKMCTALLPKPSAWNLRSINKKTFGLLDQPFHLQFNGYKEFHLFDFKFQSAQRLELVKVASTQSVSAQIQTNDVTQNIRQYFGQLRYYDLNQDDRLIVNSSFLRMSKYERVLQWKKTRMYITIERRLSDNQSGTQKDLVFEGSKSREQGRDYGNHFTILHSSA